MAISAVQLHKKWRMRRMRTHPLCPSASPPPSCLPRGRRWARLWGLGAPHSVSENLGVMYHIPKGNITVESCRTKRTTQQLHTTTTHRARLHSTTHIARICATHTTYTAAMQRNATSIPVRPSEIPTGNTEYSPYGIQPMCQNSPIGNLAIFTTQS